MTNVIEGDNVRSMFRLDEIIAPYTLAFADVKDRVKLAYMSEKLVAARDKARQRHGGRGASRNSIRQGGGQTPR